ncbi:CPBP family intramembrane glutamic endopeptidase [Pseudoclavibacter helvolus]|uniref:Membrane protease YdiL (CAAX protease family) n=1 Tax=Pseudoclavibacter helvolus TaxID=255205 RepID=A0A7W4YGY3_9MICO|nr:CPBP family intramembrane glutamic endopeptidase [Pseudoclavibacter helvolus]MBB2958591.1 membrane protease YdiL (CAAX protease family) [Pseudoclavibacter helvolus]
MSERAQNPPVTGTPQRASERVKVLHLLSALLVVCSATVLFAFENNLGYLPLAAGIALGFATDRSLGRDLLLIGIGMGIISLHSMKADISWGNIFVMGTVLSLAVAVPYAISRWGYKDHAVRFPLRRGTPWSRLEKLWLGLVLVLGWLILPFYFITSGVYQNWPAVSTASEIGRLFVGVGFVGIWDELFFICTVFTLLLRHFPFWVANALQSIVFVSFLWELGYQSWGPLLTLPFALIQGWIFTKTKSLTYVICVHLLFDLVVFLVIVHAHHPAWLPIFLY